MNSGSIFQLLLEINNLFCFIKYTMDNFSITKTDPWSRFVIGRPLNNYRSIVPVTIFVKLFISDQALKSLVLCKHFFLKYLLSELSFNQTLFELPCNPFSNFRSFIFIRLLLVSKSDAFDRLKVHTPLQHIHLER